MSEPFRWLFVDFVPLLYEKSRVARQFQVEVWLDPSPLLKSLKIENMDLRKQSTRSTMEYVV